MKTAVQTSLAPPAQTMFSSWVGRKVPPIVYEALRSPGQPLDTETRAFMEPRFNHNFGNVRVHNDTKSADSARAVSARAYTVGEQVVFGANQFAPMSHQGRELLAHELAHTIQQRSLATDSPLVHTDGTIESSASAAARTVGNGQALSSRLPATGIRLSRQPTGATEDAERARLEAEAEAALAREDKLESKWKNQEAEESEQKAARQQKLFPPVSSPLKGMPLLSDEEIPEKKRRENEDRANKARFAQDIKESHDRLLELGGQLRKSGYGYSKDAIIKAIKAIPLLELELRRHGLEWPHWYTRRKTFYYEVLDAIDKFDAAWRKKYGTGEAGGVSELTEEKVKALQEEQKRQENEAAQREGLEPVEKSFVGALGAEVARHITSDPKKITATAKAGLAAEGVFLAVAAAKGQTGMYSPDVEGPGPLANPVGPWRHSGQASTPPPSKVAPPPTREPIPTPGPVACAPESTSPTTPTTPPQGGPMRPPPGGGDRAGMTATAKTLTPHKQSTPTVEILSRGTVPMRDFEPPQPGHYIVRKPPSAATQRQLLAQAGHTTDGRLRDTNTGRALNEGEAVWGHAPKYQFKEWRDKAEKEGWTQEEFDEFFEDPDKWQIEYGPTNSSRVFDRIPRQRPVH